MRHFITIALCLFAAQGASPANAGDTSFQPAAAVRQPVAVAVIEQRAYVANRAAGTLSVVDLQSNTVEGETSVGKRLAGLTPSAPSNTKD